LWSYILLEIVGFDILNDFGYPFVVMDSRQPGKQRIDDGIDIEGVFARLKKGVCFGW
jgi:hypothetical protein